METKEILQLAEEHGLQLQTDMTFNEMGIDFKVCFATDLTGKRWVLRIPRRTDLVSQIEQEKKILEIVKKHTAVAVPDWQIVSDKLIAYPLLEDNPVITFDSETYAVTWNINQQNNSYIPSLAKVLVDLHCIPAQEALSNGVKTLTAAMSRQEVFDNLEMVRRELPIGHKLETRWQRWLDNDRLWPDFTAFIHGDLYAGHILARENGEITGIIDWSEGQVSDPSIDFSGHITVFGEDSLKELLVEYEKLGGRIWEHMFEQTVERHAAAPLNYAVFAIKTNSDQHIQAVKEQLASG